jgi:Protein of unknown function (DUF1501)
MSRSRDNQDTARGPSRRDFLRTSSLGAGAVGLSLAGVQAAPAKDVNCILLFLVGGPSQLETFDLKPDAPSGVRGPFRPIRTNVPGVELCEHLPRMAKMADHFAILRSVHHLSAPIHETGQQMMQTGRLFRSDHEYPHFGAVVSHLRGDRAGAPANVVLPHTIGNTGVTISHGQGAGSLGERHAPVLRGAAPAESLDMALRYGGNAFGRSCLAARRLIEAGTRFVTVNMFDTVFNNVTWDCHADSGSLPATLDDYRTTLLPMFDRAYSALLDDLHQRGMLASTLVLAMGEFGRTPQINPRGGRDHWPGVWSVLFAGAGIRGGQVVGSSDRLGAEPRDRPTSPAEVAATVYTALGIDPSMTLGGEPLVEAKPVRELF